MVVVDHFQVQWNVGVVDSSTALFIEALVKITLMRGNLEVFLSFLKLLLQSLDLKI